MREADRLEAMIAELLALARSTGGEQVVVDAPSGRPRPRRRLDRALRPLRTQRLDPAGADVRGLASQAPIGQVLDVLLDNALRHGTGP